ncbi:MAG: hypothetical protein DYG89_05110 [Caldilinea sp. CFX5]|nr:hypothetical protein [Caldilinea sp. CFX5]
MSHSPGRPAKPDGQKRKQLHISLYAEDIDRLDQLTDNRSDFVRQCIQESWTKQKEAESVTVTLSLPKWVVREALQFVEENLSPEESALVQKLVKRLLASPEQQPTPIALINGHEATFGAHELVR